MALGVRPSKHNCPSARGISARLFEVVGYVHSVASSLWPPAIRPGPQPKIGQV